MKKTLLIFTCTLTLLFPSKIAEIKRGKVYSSTHGYIHLSPLIGARILEDGSDIGIDLSP